MPLIWATAYFYLFTPHLFLLKMWRMYKCDKLQTDGQ